MAKSRYREAGCVSEARLQDRMDELRATISGAFANATIELGVPYGSWRLAESPGTYTASGRPQLKEIASFDNRQDRDLVARTMRRAFNERHVGPVFLTTKDGKRGDFPYKLALYTRGPGMTAPYETYIAMGEALRCAENELHKRPRRPQR